MSFLKKSHVRGVLCSRLMILDLLGTVYFLMSSFIMEHYETRLIVLDATTIFYIHYSQFDIK